MIGRRVRVLLNGVDVSAHVRSVQVQADVNSVVLARLELAAMPEVREGVMSFTLPGPVATGPLLGPDGPLRAVFVREDQ